jgi:hypothetical protein
VLTVRSFTPQSVILDRTDTGSVPLTATMTGKISDDGNSLSNGVLSFTGGPTIPFQMTWGTALTTLPGSDQERDGVSGSQPRQPSITVEDMIQGAQNVRDAIELLQFFAVLFQ